MLALTRVPNLSARLVAKRAALVAGQRQAGVQSVRRRENVSTRGVQTVAQTDRVGQFFLYNVAIRLPYNRTLSHDYCTLLELNGRLNVICASFRLPRTHLSLLNLPS
jgi:hypothetical protein